MKPLRDCVIVIKDEAATQSPGGIFMPGTVEEKLVTGKVVAAGSGKVASDGTVIPMEVKVDDRVCFNKHLVTELKLDGQVFHLVREDQILCIL